jgi:hypothetical protein
MKVNELGAGIDALYSLREARLDLERKIKEMKSEEYALRNDILLTLGECGLAKASGGLATASVRTSLVPVVEDWNLVYSYIAENDRFDLMQKRISTVAWRDLKESGELVPGTVAVEDCDISLTKSSRS